MAVYTVDENGQLVVTPSLLNDFTYFRDNVLVRTYEEFLTANADNISLLAPIIYDDRNMPGSFNGCVDSNGKVYLIFLNWDQSLYDYTASYLTNATGTWVLHDIDSVSYNSLNYFTHIKIDSSGYLHCCYIEINATTSTMVYATNATGSWVITEMYGTGYTAYVGRSGGLFQDSSGYWHIIWSSYVVTAPQPRRIYHSTNATGSWQTEEVLYREGGAFWGVLAIMNNDNSITLFYENSGLVTITGTWGSWGSETAISTTDTLTTSSVTNLLLDENGYIHLIYKSYGNQLYELTNAPSGTWSDTLIFDLSPDYTIGTTGLSLVYDSNWNLHLLFEFINQSTSKRNIAYANNISGWSSWEQITFDHWRVYPLLLIYNDSLMAYFTDVTDSADRNLREKEI